MKPLFTKTEETKRFHYDRKEEHFDNVQIRHPKVFIDFDSTKKEWVAMVDSKIYERNSSLYVLLYKCRENGIIKNSVYDSILSSM